ncbi:hypothetical protein TNCV_4230441 [Trichonephila clavipes]|uniref:Uncharacterized protein n=1 Tax=Trichonephila clavipes TaxID=2585209 RepID=A0A8X6SHL4_TRICX|nr:hypothetical protein TNCV_4230441 [Trichonephila clavipes]
MPPNIQNTRSTSSLDKRVRKSCGSSGIHECRGTKNISLPSSTMPKLWRWNAVVSSSVVKSNLSHRLWQHSFLSFGNFTELNRTVTYVEGIRTLGSDVDTIDEDGSVGVIIVLAEESMTSDTGVGGCGSDTVAAIEEAGGKSCAWVEDDDVVTEGVNCDAFGFGDMKAVAVNLKVDILF